MTSRTAARPGDLVVVRTSRRTGPSTSVLAIVAAATQKGVVTRFWEGAFRGETLPQMSRMSLAELKADLGPGTPITSFHEVLVVPPDQIADRHGFWMAGHSRCWPDHPDQPRPWEDLEALKAALRPFTTRPARAS